MADKVKCKDCGLLALRFVNGFELKEAPPEFREHGKVVQPGGQVTFETSPSCAAMRRDFTGGHYTPNGDYYSAVISQDRECDEFIEWTPTFSPKEHVEMSFHRKIIEDNRKWLEKEDSRRSREFWIGVALSLFTASISVLAVLIAADKITIPWIQPRSMTEQESTDR